MRLLGSKLFIMFALILTVGCATLIEQPKSGPIEQKQTAEASAEKQVLPTDEWITIQHWMAGTYVCRASTGLQLVAIVPNEPGEDSYGIFCDHQNAPEAAYITDVPLQEVFDNEVRPILEQHRKGRHSAPRNPELTL